MCQGGVIGRGPAMSGREGYRSSSVSCWDRQFGYGQCRRCGVPHFVTGSLAVGEKRTSPRGLD